MIYPLKALDELPETEVSIELNFSKHISHSLSLTPGISLYREMQLFTTVT